MGLTRGVLSLLLLTQTSHYIARGLFLMICHGANLSMDQFFAFHSQTLSTVDGIKNCFAVFAAGLLRYGDVHATEEGNAAVLYQQYAAY